MLATVLQSTDDQSIQTKLTYRVCDIDPLAHQSVAQHSVVNSPVVEIEALTRRFGAFTAVGSLTLAANTREVFGLLGSNGAGKSTTIKMLATLLPPTSDEARVGGFSITAQPVEVRRAIGYVLTLPRQTYRLASYSNAKEYVWLGKVNRSDRVSYIDLSFAVVCASLRQVLL